MSRLSTRQLGEILDDVYTIEGYLQLALARPDYNEKIQSLLASRVFEMADKMAEWDSENLLRHRETIAEAREKRLEENSSYRLSESEDDEPETPEQNEAESGSPKPAEEVTISDRDPLLVTATPVSPLESDEITQPRRVAEEEQPDPEPETPLMAHVTPTEEEPVTEVVVTAVKNETDPKPRPVFSLNDRYLFTRTLFHNSVTEFEDCLRMISQMENFDEAEDYFIHELEWNPEDSSVSLFMEMIQRYFDTNQH